MSNQDRLDRFARAAAVGLLTPAEARDAEGLAPAYFRAAKARLAKAAPVADQGRWYQIHAAADGPPEVKIYADIDAYWGIDPAVFAEELAAIDAPEITVRINSLGGFVYDGIAIYNAIADHPAHITTVVDSVAASIASIIALAGDHRVMNRGAEMMIHDAWGIVIGPATDMRAAADSLDRQNRKLAGIYHDRAGGTVDAWLAAMSVETWYDADEAVAAGLAHEAVKTQPETDAQNAVDLSMFRHAGRAAAPPPAMPNQIPTSSAPDAAPDTPAAETAAGDQAADRLRSTSVATRARAVVALATSLTESPRT